MINLKIFYMFYTFSERSYFLKLADIHLTNCIEDKVNISGLLQLLLLSIWLLSSRTFIFSNNLKLLFWSYYLQSSGIPKSSPFQWLISESMSLGVRKPYLVILVAQTGEHHRKLSQNMMKREPRLPGYFCDDTPLLFQQMDPSVV